MTAIDPAKSQTFAVAFSVSRALLRDAKEAEQAIAYQKASAMRNAITELEAEAERSHKGERYAVTFAPWEVYDPSKDLKRYGDITATYEPIEYRRRLYVTWT